MHIIIIHILFLNVSYSYMIRENFIDHYLSINLFVHVMHHCNSHGSFSIILPLRALFLLAVRTVQHLSLFCRKVNEFILITSIEIRRDFYSSLIIWS